MPTKQKERHEVRVAEPQGAQLTILQPVPKKYCCKQIEKGRDGPKVIANRISKEFSFTVHDFAEPMDLFNLQERLIYDPYSFVVRGHPVAGIDLSRDVRRILRSDGTGTLASESRSWVTLDVDGLPSHEDGGILRNAFDPADPVTTVRDVIELLPHVFRERTVHWRYSGSQGFKGETVSMHLTFALDVPVSDDDLKRYFNTFNEGFLAVYGRRLIDPALFNPIQPHYTAAPIIEDGVIDPMVERHGILMGDQDVVEISAEWVIDPEDEADAKRRYIQFFDTIGDDKDGFHHPIMQGIASWINFHGEPEAGARTELKRLLRSYIDDASVAPDRPASDVERYKSDPFLDNLIDGAVNKGFASGQRKNIDLTELLGRYVYVRVDDAFYDPLKEMSFSPQVVKNTYAMMAPGKNIANKLLETPDLRTVDMLHYTPGHEAQLMLHKQKRIWNTWKGHAVQPAQEAGDVKLFTDHLRYLVDGDEGGYAHLSAFIAWTIARPEQKIRHAAVIGSQREGTGKSYLKVVLRGILGPDNVTEVSTDQLKEQFNSWVGGTELVFIEELMAGGRMDMANHLKPLISESSVSIRKMRTDAYEVDNYATFIATTNHRDAMVLTKDSRRYWVWFSEAEPKTAKYYKKLFEWTKENLPAIAKWAYDYDFSNFNPEAPPPKTKSFHEMVEASAPPMTSYMLDQIEACDWPFQSDLVVVSDLSMALRGVPGFGRTSNAKLSNVLKEIGARSLGQKRFPDGTKPRVWAVRNTDKWSAAPEKDIVNEYSAPGRWEDRNLDNF